MASKVTEVESFTPDSEPLHNLLDLLNPSLSDNNLRCIEYVCEFALGVSKDQIRSQAKDAETRKVILNALFSMLPQDVAPLLLNLILTRLNYKPKNKRIRKQRSKLPAVTPDKEKEIYEQYPKLDMWLTLTIAMTSMSEDNYRELQDHVRLEVLHDSHSIDNIESRCHLLELVNNQPRPDEVNPEPVFDPKDLSNVLTWFEDCGLEYPEEIVQYQQCYEIPVPTRAKPGAIATRTGGAISTGTGGAISTRTGGAISTRTGGAIATGTGGTISTRTGGTISTGTGGAISTGTESLEKLGLVPDRLALLNDSLTNKQLLCIEYVCEFGLGINKELVASTKDQWGMLIFNLLFNNVPSQQISDAPSLLHLILSRLRYSTRDEHIKTHILRRLPVMTKSDKEAIYDKYPNFDMWLTLTVAMISMRDSDYRVLKDHLRLNVLTGYSDTGIMSPCHLLELMKNQPEPHGFDSESLNNVLKWFRDCGLKYPKEIVNYQKRHNQQVPTHWEICK